MSHAQDDRSRRNAGEAREGLSAGQRALPFLMGLIFAGAGGLILAQAIGLGQFVGRSLVPGYILGLVGAVFFGTGLLLLKMAFVSAPTAAEAAATRQILSNEDKGGIAGVWIFTGIWCAMTGIMDWLLLSGRTFHWALVFVAVAFSLFGAFALYTSVTKSLEYLKCGRIVLHLGGPVAIGGKLEGCIPLGYALRPAGEISANLVCIRARFTRAGGDGSVSQDEAEIWSRKQNSPIAWSGGRGLAIAYIALPPNLPATDLPDVGTFEMEFDYHRWELRIGAKIPGIDLDRTFRIRVQPAA